MEDADASSAINFDTVPFGAKHWCVVVDGSRSPIPFTSRDGAAAAARAQARQFYLYRELPTLVRIMSPDGTLKHTDCYNHNTLNEIMAVPLADRLSVSQRERLASDTWLENDAVNHHTEPVVQPRSDMETSRPLPCSRGSERPSPKGCLSQPSPLQHSRLALARFASPFFKRETP
ncbi:hypothetical protein [Lysobacter enzymogenes]|uniref:hypothetical protein n=1 Tax=Lysobacter enzymogenes TaxID=69 RepID=UPI000F4C2808|nr:hypothetical protein [Lysobacter enzymogenes]